MENKPKLKIPNHIAIIPDGNEEWASERNLPKLDGYKKGYENAIKSPQWFFKAGVAVLSIFLFSTADWKKPREEVNLLMKSIKSILEENLIELKEKKYKIIISGRIEELPGDLPQICSTTMDKTKNNTGGTLNFCLNYGGREEIIDAIKKIIKNKIEIEQIHEGIVKKYLYNSESTSPDLIIRTSGQKTLLGFQLWQSVNSELIFLEKYWPDFEESDVGLIIEEYNSRLV